MFNQYSAKAPIPRKMVKNVDVVEFNFDAPKDLGNIIYARNNLSRRIVTCDEEMTRQTERATAAIIAVSACVVFCPPLCR